MTPEEIRDKAKAAKIEKAKENYLIIYFSYEKQLILPHKEGVALLATLNSAEHYSEGYPDDSIKPIGKDFMHSSMLSAKEYDHIKMAQLLGVTPTELREALNSQTNSQ